MADDSTGRDSDKFMLRLPNGMRDRLKAEAEANKRSMNAEIVARLETTFLGGQLMAATGTTPGKIPPRQAMALMVDVMYDMFDKMQELKDKGELTAENLHKSLTHDHNKK